MTTITLQQMIEEELGPPCKREGGDTSRPWWLCPFHPDGNPSFTITPDGEHFYCFGCGQRGDAADLLRRFHPELTYLDARKRLDPQNSRWPRWPRSPKKSGGPPLATLPQAPTAEWQQRVAKIAETAQRKLWSAAGREGLGWLRQRGLNAETIRSASLGYRAKDTASLPAGITLPWKHHHKSVGLRVRRLSGTPKYQLMSGSTRIGWYPDLFLLAGKKVLVCEGEFDALLLNQECGPHVVAVTLGSASARPTASDLAAVAGASSLLLAYDADEAGEKACEYWRELVPKAIRLKPPKGKDWTEAWQAGVNLKTIVRHTR